LFVALDIQLRGKFDPQQATVEQHEKSEHGDLDLLDLAAVQTLLNSGTVYALESQEMPENAQIAAIYRYALEA
jgi:hypothetical protein